MSMVEVKTADLIGSALDWAAAVACREHVEGFEPSTDWAQGGPLIKKYGVLLSPPTSLVHQNFGSFDKRNGYYESGVWSTTIFGLERKHRRTSFSHKTEPLIPAMRSIVQFELGDVVSVPASLVTP